MKSIIIDKFMGSTTIDVKTDLGHEWSNAIEKLENSYQILEQHLKKQPKVLKVFKDFESAYEETMTAECDYLFEEGFRYGFFLAAELYGKKGGDGE